LLLELASITGNASDIQKELEERLKMASPEVLRDREVAMKVVSVDGALLARFAPAIADDEEVVRAALRCRGILSLASPRLQSSKDFVMEQVRLDGDALCWAPADLHEDPEVVLEAIKSKGSAMAFASEELREDFDFVSQALEIDGWALEFVSDELKANREIILKAINSQGWVLQYASEELRGDPDVVLQAVKNDGVALKFASTDLRSDKTLVLEAVRSSGAAIQSASDDLTMDEDFLLLAARHCQGEASFAWFTIKARDCVWRWASKNMTWVQFLEAYNSSLAAPGQQAPLLSVVLTKVGEEDAGNFRCDATLMSGTSFSLDLNLQELSNREDGCTNRDPVLNDLAAKLVEQLPLHVQANGSEHIFIVFDMGLDDGTNIPTTAWDAHRPLSDFFPA